MSGARNVIVVMTHTAKDGAPKLVRECSLPLTSLRPVTWVVTELATFGVGENGLSLFEYAPGAGVDTVRAKNAERFQEAAPRTWCYRLRSSAAVCPRPRSRMFTWGAPISRARTTGMLRGWAFCSPDIRN